MATREWKLNATVNDDPQLQLKSNENEKRGKGEKRTEEKRTGKERAF